MIMWVPPIWGQPFEAPSERAAPRANSHNCPSSKDCGADAETACGQAEALKLVRVEDRGRRAPSGPSGVHRDCTLSQPRPVADVCPSAPVSLVDKTDQRIVSLCVKALCY